MNILVLPSWYPVDNNKHGQFFRNEALLVSKYAQVTLIFVSINYVKRRSLKSIFRFLTSSKEPKVQRFLHGNFQEIIVKIQIWPNKKVDYPISKVTSVIKNLITNEKLNFDLIHAHSTIFGGMVASKLSNFCDIPYIITEHQHIPFLINQIKNSQDLFSILNRSSRVLSVSNYQRQQLLSFGVKNQIDIIGNYINEFVFSLKVNLKRNDIFTILYVAYDGYIKDFKTFTDAICRLQYQIPQFQVNIITSSENTQIQNLISNITNDKIKVNVFFGIDNDKMPSFYHSADIFVSTSIAETFGVSHVEALYCGTPVISTLSGGVSDFLDSKNAILIPVQNSLELQMQLHNFYKKSFAFNPFELRESVVNIYDSINFSGRLIEIYKSVLLENKPKL